MPGIRVHRCAILLALMVVSPAAASEHWSLKPRTKPSVPALESSWISNPIDAFILARLEKAGLKPSPEANAETLIRRLTFDLIGLPPTPEEVSEFVSQYRSAASKRQAAWEK